MYDMFPTTGKLNTTNKNEQNEMMFIMIKVVSIQHSTMPYSKCNCI